MALPKAVEYVYVCRKSAEDDRMIDVILEQIEGARALYAPQGRISVRIEEKATDDDSTPVQA